MSVRLTVAALPFLLPIALAAMPLRAATFFVDTREDVIYDHPGDGLCDTAVGTCSLRAAVQEANALAGYDTIVLVSNDEYALNIPASGDDDDDASGDLDIDEALAIVGVPGDTDWAASVTANCGTCFRIFDIHSGTREQPVRIDRVSIEFGYTESPEGGAGILVRPGAALDYARGMFYANSSLHAGTALSVYGYAHVSDSFVFDNHQWSQGEGADARGAVYAGGDGELELEHVPFNANSANFGGGLAADGNAYVAARRVTFAGAAVGDGDPNENARGQQLWLAGDARVQVESGTFVELRDDHVQHDGIVVDERAQLELRYASLGGSVGIDVAADASASLYASVIYDAPTATPGPPHCVGAIRSLGENRISRDCALVGEAAPGDLRPEVLRAETKFSLLFPQAIGTFFGTIGEYVMQANEPALLDLFVDVACPAIDQLGGARPAARAPGLPRVCDAGALELPADHLLIDDFDS